VRELRGIRTLATARSHFDARIALGRTASEVVVKRGRADIAPGLTTDLRDGLARVIELLGTSQGLIGDLARAASGLRGSGGGFGGSGSGDGFGGHDWYLLSFWFGWAWRALSRPPSQYGR